MDNAFKRAFAELTEQAATIEASKRNEYNSFIGSNQLQVDCNALLNWKTRAKSLLVKACGDNSQHFLQFVDSESSMNSTSFENLQRMRSVFDAAKQDFEAGYLASAHDLIRAEVFGSELEQASELLRANYPLAAAVIAGAVLETTIRGLCNRNQLATGKLDKMNADLAKAGIYSGLVQKRVTYLANIRNSAAHGNTAEFNLYDVTAMIGEVEQFVASHLS